MSSSPDRSQSVTSTLADHAANPFRLLVEAVQDYAIFMLDPGGNVASWNSGAERIKGYKAEEVIGRHFSLFYLAEDVDAGKPEQMLQQALAEGRCEEEDQRLRKDGTPFWAVVTTTALFDHVNNHIGFATITRDISEQRRAKLALQTSEARYRTLFESAPLGILYADAESYYLDANASMCQMLGYSRDELIGLHASDIIAPAEIQFIQPTINQIYRESDHRREWQFRRKDGSVFAVDVTATKFADGALLGMIRDITTLKEHEREIARISRLYAALSQVNQAIVWTKTRDELFQKVCRALVEHGGLHLTWIGWHNPETHRLVPVAEWGDDSGYLQNISIYVDDRPQGRGPAGTAFRSGRPYICNNILNDPATLPWRAQLERCGFLATAVFPIRLKEEVCGIIHVYADEPGFFQNREIALLQEAATDLSFALDNFARDEARRQAEQTVENEKLFSDTMIESMPGILYFYDIAGRFLRWNRNFETVSGYSGEEIARMHPLDFFSGEDRQQVEQRIAEVFANGEASVEASFVAKDGRATPYFFTGRRVVAQDRTCLIGVGIDISERKQAELRFRTLFEQTPVGVVVVDPATASIIECNEQAARQLGYTPQEFCQLSISDIEAIVTWEDIRQRIEKLLIEGRSQFETQHRTRSGEIRDIFVSGQIIELAERKVIHCVFLDITDRVRIEAEREKRHQAEAADRIKSAFLATMSHELRTPLNSIIGFTGIILQELAGPLNAEQSKQLGMVRTSARHLLALVNDVLDISKIEAGQLEVARAPFDLRRSITKVLALITPQAEAKQLNLRVYLPPDLGEVVSDERRFEQILLNLLSNAIKFTEHGEITLAAELVADFTLPDAAAGQPAVCLRICDTGMGIKPEALSSLFQPFRQIDSGLARNHEGTGLGLAICQRLAALMGGEIRVESTWGQGSTFSVTLPLEGPAKP